MRAKKVIAGILLTVMLLENSLTSLAAPVAGAEVISETVTDTEDKIYQTESVPESVTEPEGEEAESGESTSAEDSSEVGSSSSEEESVSSESSLTETIEETEAAEQTTEMESVSEQEETVETVTETVEETLTEFVTETAVDNVVSKDMAVAELDYILGRPMTEAEIAAQEALVPENLPQLEVMPMEGMSDIDAGLNQISLFSTTSLPEKYDSRDEDIITSVKNQNPWGTCWSFATMALMESSWLQQFNETIDLSERHLAYFVKYTGYDPLGNASDDTIVPYNDSFYLESGGNLYKSAVKMMNWHGAAAEANYPYSNSDTVPAAIAAENAQDILAYPKNVFFISTKNATQDEKVKTVKELIQTYGCVEWSYYHDSDFYNASTGAFYLNSSAYGTNHSITVVGWDDTYSKNNFRSDLQPESDGAWIVKNSWGTGFGDDGYIYISYEDQSLGCGNPVAVIVAGDAQDYDNNYFYGNIVSNRLLSPCQSIANVYTINGDTAKQKIKAVSFMAGQENVSYSIQLYKNPDTADGVVTNPASGTPLLEEAVTGEVGYTGLYTVEIPEITVSMDDCISVVVSFDSAGYIYFTSSTTTSFTDGSVALTEVNVTTPGESFYNSSTAANGWVDGADSGRSYLVNLLTENVSETVTTPTLSYTLGAPDGFTDTIACNLKWVKCSNALSYELYRAEDAEGTYEKIADISASNRTYQDSIALADREKTYYYKLAAVYADDVVEESQSVAVDVSSVQFVPEIDFKQYMNFTLLEWEEMNGAAGYAIEKKTSDETSYSHLADIKVGEALSYKDKAASDLYENVYDYRIRAYTADGVYSDWKEWSTTDVFSLTQNGSSQISLKWKKVNDAAYFRLRMDNYIWPMEYYSSVRINDVNPMGDVKKYYMEMYASEDAFNNGDMPVYVTPYIYYYAVPETLTNLAASWDGEEASFTWDATTTADSIVIYRSRDAENKGETAYAEVEGTATTYEDSNFIESGTYYYWFEPQKANSAGEMVVGDAVSVQLNIEVDTSIDPVVRISAAAKTSDSIEVTWEKHAAAEGYKLYRKDGVKGTYALLTEISGADQTIYEDAAILTGKTYYYKVTALRDETESDPSVTNEVSARTAPAAVTIAEDGISHEEITINGVAGLEYAIGSVSADKTVLTYTKAADTTVTFDGLEPNTAYMIYVRTDSEITGEAAVYGPALSVSTFLKAEMQLSIKDVVLSKGNKLPFRYTITPDNLHYKDSLVWSAMDADGLAYEDIQVSSTADTVVVNGRDGNEICRISNGYFYATGESEDKEVYVTVKRGSLEADFHARIHVPVTEMQMDVVSVNNDAAITSLEGFCIGQTAQLELTVLPVNAEETIQWSSSNEKVASVTVSETDDTRTGITANGTGSCVITAVSSDGVKASMTVVVNRVSPLYGIWISDMDDLSGAMVEKDPLTGEYFSEKLKKQPIFALNDTTVTTMTVVSYILDDENGGAVRKAEEADGIIYRSSNTSVAQVTQDGTITSVGSGEADIIAYESKGNGIYGSCHVIVTAQDAETPKADGYPLDKKIKLSAVAKNLNLEAFALDEKSSCQVQIKDQNGKIYSSEEEKQLFTYSSAKPSVCMVDENGVVRPNPTYTGKTTSVKITAALKDDAAGRKVTFTVKLLAERQIDRIQLECISASENAAVTEEKITEVFTKGGTLTFAVEAYDSKGNVIENPKLKFVMSDTKVAKVKDNKNGTVTVTMNKAGRSNLSITGNDVWKKTVSVQIVAADTKPYLSKSTLTMNMKLASYEQDGWEWKASEDLSVSVQDGVELKSLDIVGVSIGKNALSGAELTNLAWMENEDGSYHVAVKEAYIKNLPKNAKLSVNVQAEVESGLLGQTVTESFTVTVKVTSQEPKITVAEAKSINRFYSDKDETLLILKAPSIITEVEVLNSEYFTVTELKRGQWYLKFSDPDGTYKAKNTKLTLRLTADGYEPVEKKLTVQTPYKAPVLKQQTVPVLHLGNEQLQQAEIILYDKTNKVELSGYEIKSFASVKLDEGAVAGSSFYVGLKEDVSFKNNERPSAQISVQAEEWAAPVSLKVSVKVSTKNPKITMSSGKVTLNCQAAAERTSVTLASDQKNVAINSAADWDIQMYDPDAREWFPIMEEFGNDWLSVSYDASVQKMVVGIRTDKTVSKGSYKFRVKNVLEGFEEVYKDFTVKVIDVKPTVSISVKGKQDLINRASGTLMGTFKFKNAVASKATDVVILSEDGTAPDPTFEAKLLTNGTFTIRLTEEGMNDTSLKKQKVTLPVVVTMENGTKIYGMMRFSLTQANPKVKVPSVQTINKTMSGLTKEYDFAGGLADGVALNKIDVVSVPKGFTAFYKDGSVVVTLNDRGIKAGTYQIKVNLSFEGAAEGTKPVSKTIKVKVAE